MLINFQVKSLLRKKEKFDGASMHPVSQFLNRYLHWRIPFVDTNKAIISLLPFHNILLWMPSRTRDIVVKSSRSSFQRLRAWTWITNDHVLTLHIHDAIIDNSLRYLRILRLLPRSLIPLNYQLQDINLKKEQSTLSDTSPSIWTVHIIV